MTLITYDAVNSNVESVIERVDFQVASGVSGQAFVYFRQPYTVASVDKSHEIAQFIINKPEWKGDRSIESISAEIYIHWVAENMRPYFMTNPINEAVWKSFVIGITDDRPSPIYPTHLGYNYAGLNKSHPMDQFLLTL
jgi:hypothetical protein